MASPVQTVKATGVSTATITTPAFGSSVTVGNTLLAQGCKATPSAPASNAFSDFLANTWTIDQTGDGHTLTNHPVAAQMGHAPIVTGGANETVSWIWNSGVTNMQLIAQEWAGALTVDQAANNTAGSSTTSITATTATTTNANDLFIGIFVGKTTTTSTSVIDPANVNGSQAGVTSLDLIAATTVLAIEVSYATLAATGAEAMNWTYASDATGGYACAAVAYKLPASDVPTAQIIL